MSHVTHPDTVRVDTTCPEEGDHENTH